MRVCGYARVSTDIQREKESIKTQVELIEKFCQANGHTLVAMFCDDGVSGTTSLRERPAASQLLTAAHAGQFDALVCYKSDRIARDTLVAELAVRELHDELGLAFFGVAESIDLTTPIGRAMFTFQGAIAKLERENTLQRSRDATLRLAREGVWLGGIVPFGYRVEGKDREARLRPSDEPIPGLQESEADVVRQIYKWSGEDGLSCIQIAERLNRWGVPTVYTRDNRQVLIPHKRKHKTQGVWRAGRVRHILSETTYRGVHRWGKRAKRSLRPAQGDTRIHSSASSTANSGRGSLQKNLPPLASPPIIERAVPALVDETLWNKAQVTLHNNRLCRPDIEKRPYLLRGLMKCRHCGLTYVGTVSAAKQLRQASEGEKSTSEARGQYLLRPYYVCNGTHTKHFAATDSLPNSSFSASSLGSASASGASGQSSSGQASESGTPERNNSTVNDSAANNSVRFCPSGYVRAKELEELIWHEILGFVRSPEAVICELRAQLRELFESGSETKEQLALFHNQKAVLEEERAVLFRLFRRGGISEADLERQRTEIEDEEQTLCHQIAQLEREVSRASEAHLTLERAREYLAHLQELLWAETNGESGAIPQDQNPEGSAERSREGLSWTTQRRIVEALVAGIEVETEHDCHRKRGQRRAATFYVTYRFEWPDAADLKPRTGKSAKVTPSLSLTRTHRMAPGTAQRQAVRAQWIQNALAAHTSSAHISREDAGKPQETLFSTPMVSTSSDKEASRAVSGAGTLRIEDIIAHVQREQGVTLSRATVCRVRKELGFSPRRG